jgi:hypothetical protein
MNLVLFDDPATRINLLPFTFTRPISKIRVGILTISEKWEKRLTTTASFLTESYLQKKFPAKASFDNLFINAAWCPNDKAIEQVKVMMHGEILVHGNTILAWKSSDMALPDLGKVSPKVFQRMLR